MSEFFPVILIALVGIIMICIAASKSKRKGNIMRRIEYDSTYDTVQNIYFSWFRSSKMAKTENSYVVISAMFSTLFGTFCVFKMLYKPNMENDKILRYLKGEFKESLFLLVLVVCAVVFVNRIFGFLSCIDRAKWLQNNGIDCYPAIVDTYKKIKKGDLVILMGIDEVENSYLIQMRPSAKKIFLYKLVAKGCIYILTAYASASYALSVVLNIAYMVDKGDVEDLFTMFISSELILLAGAIAVNVVVSMQFDKMIKKKKGMLFRAVTQQRTHGGQ